MATTDHGPNGASNQGGIFTTTHWSLVLKARERLGADGDAALDRLCRSYWPALYQYIRREGYRPEDAQDLTQEFLSRLVQKEWLNRVEAQRGRFRTFLLTYLKHFLSDQRDRARAQKRGGGQPLVPLDAFDAEERDAIVPAASQSPDEHYDQRWARVIMDEAARRLRESYCRRNKLAWFELLKDQPPGEHGERNYTEIAAQLGTTEQAVKNAALRLRQRYGRLLREEITQTVTDPADLKAEFQYFLALFSR